MKEKKLFDALSFVDESFIEDANPNKTPKGMPLWTKRLAYLAVAACLMLAVVLPIVFWGGNDGALPVYSSATSDDTGTNSDNIPSHLQEYQDSPYYPLIERLDVYYNKGSSNASPNTPSNGKDPTEATEIVVFPLFPDETWTPSFAYDYSPEQPKFPTNLSDGVTEADHIAHSDTHVFHLIDGVSLDVYSADSAESKLVGSLSLEGTRYGNMHLLNGGNKILLMGTNDSRGGTDLLYLDVSDPANMKEIKQISVSGGFESSFQTDESVLIYTTHWLSSTPDFHEISSFVPTVTDGNRVTALSCENIIFPKSLTRTIYSVLYLFDAKTMTFEGGNAFLGETIGEFYVYPDHVLVAMTGNLITKTEGRYDFKGSTTIHCFPYGNGSFEHKGSVTIDGYLNTSYCLDEHDGILRVVTAAYYLAYKKHTPSTPSFTPPETVETTADPFAEESPEMATDEGVVMLGWTEEELRDYYHADEYSGTNLYCISLDSFEVVASLERLTPDGQTSQSIWFDGDLIHVTTHAPYSNQIYTIDLSDLSNITCKSTTDEERYSCTLRYDEDTVLRLGYQEGWVMKLELFRDTEDGLVSLDQFVKENVELKDWYQLYYIDFDKKLFGIYFAPHQGRDDLGDFYILFSFASGKLDKIVEVNEEWFGWAFRATYVNGYLYMFGEISWGNFFRVVEAKKP